ncbi:hypothetical protein CSC62_07615 [Pseudoxanthomonas jiangsuensis]|nr:hypothetical protein CSC62_07615 [Pseudoxanthomonas jiangsuensis]
MNRLEKTRELEQQALELELDVGGDWRDRARRCASATALRRRAAALRGGRPAFVPDWTEAAA